MRYLVDLRVMDVEHLIDHLEASIAARKAYAVQLLGISTPLGASLDSRCSASKAEKEEGACAAEHVLEPDQDGAGSLCI